MSATNHIFIAHDLLVSSHLAIIPLRVSCPLQMGGRGHLVPVGGERLSGSAKGKVRPRPDHRHAARRPGQPEGGTLLPQEESRGGEIPAEATGTSGVVSECLLIKIITSRAVKCRLVKMSTVCAEKWALSLSDIT